MTGIGSEGTRSKAPDKKPFGQKPPNNKPPTIIAKYTVDANLFRLGSTNSKKNIQSLVFCLGFYTGGLLSGVFCPGAFDLEPFRVTFRNNTVNSYSVDYDTWV